MKRIRTHYDNLKVVRNAPAEVIRAAYKSLSQKYHPDRNPDNPDAARIMSIINTSYEVLSDPIKRRKHDEWIKSHEPENILRNNQQKRTSAKYELPTSGICLLSDLPDNAQERLILLCSSKNDQQFAVKIDGVVWNYIWTFVLASWFIYLLNDATAYKWDEESLLWLIVISSIASILLCINISWIIQWHLARIRCWLIISPLYIIKTQLDKVWFWPIWSISNIKGTHNYRNGIYQGTSLELTLDGKHESFNISPAAAYDKFLSILRKYDTDFRYAINNGDFDYLLENDDFITCNRVSETKNTNKAVYLVYISILSCSVILFATAYTLNTEQPIKPVSSNIPYSSSQPSSRQSYTRPKTAPSGEPWPKNASYVAGYELLNTNGLSTVTVDNTRNDSDVFVKLIYLNSTEAYPARVFFIPAYGKFTANDIRPGEYDIRYRDLSLGTLAKTETFVLEERSSLYGTEYSNISMTLYKVHNGNMQTYAISENEF